MEGRTVKQVAADLGVTPQAVRDEIRKAALQSTLQRRGRSFVIPKETESRIVAAITGRRNGDTMQSTLQSTLQSNAKNTQSFAKHFAKDEQPEIDPRDEEIRFLRGQVGVLNDEIQKLHEHQEQLTETITQLTASISNLTASVQAAQLLHAASMERITTTEEVAQGDPGEEQADTQPEAVPEEQPRRTWWQRFFG